MSAVVRCACGSWCGPFISLVVTRVGEDVGGRRWRGFKLKDTFKILVHRFLCIKVSFWI